MRGNSIERQKACGAWISNHIFDVNALSYSKADVPFSELFFFYTLVALSCFFVYVKTQFGLLFFSTLLAWSAISKKHYFWLAFFFLLIQAPGHLFMYSYDYHLPVIRLSEEIAFDMVDVFTALMLARCIILRKKIYLNLKGPMILLFAYFIFSFFRGALLYSSSPDISISFIRQLVYYSWIFIFVGLIEDKENLLKFIKLLLPVTFFILFTQLYFLATGAEFIALFDPSAWMARYNDLTGEMRPVAGGILLLFLNFIGVAILLKYRRETIVRWMLYLVVAAVCISVFISATRIWFVLFFIVGAGCYFRKAKDLSRLLLSIMFVLALLLCLGALSFDYLQHDALGRIAQMSKLISGKAEEIGTLGSRLVMLQIMWGYFLKEPIFGYGFSEAMIDNWQGHWGFFSTLYELGICGLLLFISVFIKYLKMVVKKIKLAENETLRDVLKVLLVSFIGMLVLYASFWNFFSTIHTDRILFLMIFFGISEIFVGYPLKTKGDDGVG